MRASHSSRPTDRCKGQSDFTTENPSDAPTPRRFVPLATTALAGTPCASASKPQVPIRPYARVPHDIAADPRVSQTDLRVLAALLYYARDTLVCRPCDASIGQRVCRSPGTIQRSLRRLEAIGYIAREAVQPSDENRTGRLIHLLWCEPDWPRPIPDPPNASARPPKRQRDPPNASARQRKRRRKRT